MLLLSFTLSMGMLPLIDFYGSSASSFSPQSRGRHEKMLTSLLLLSLDSFDAWVIIVLFYYIFFHFQLRAQHYFLEQ